MLKVCSNEPLEKVFSSEREREGIAVNAGEKERTRSRHSVELLREDLFSRCVKEGSALS